MELKELVACSCYPLFVQLDYFGSGLPCFLCCCFCLDLASQKLIFLDFGYPVSVKLTWGVDLNELFHFVSVWLLIEEFLQGALVLHWDER
jgi:hypothetical protein